MTISLYVPTRLKFLPAKTPTVPPPPDLSDGTPVYLYAVIRSSDNIFFVGYLVGYDGMPRVAKELSAIEVKRLTKPGMQAVGGVAGLYLQVTSPNARSWILRTRVADKRRDRFCRDKHKRQSSACLISAKAQSTAPCARCSNGSTILW